jgi:general L-amino acid transport system permease protein
VTAASAPWPLRLRERAPSLLLQLLVAVIAVVGFWAIYRNTVTNLGRMGVEPGFGFLLEESGFDISQKALAYSPSSSYLAAIAVAFVNTLLVAAAGIALSTIIGLVVALSRFSSNPLLSAIARLYVETFRNVPLLLQIFVWYFGILSTLPPVRSSVSVGGVYFTNRGLFLPAPALTATGWVLVALIPMVLIGTVVLRRRLVDAPPRTRHALVGGAAVLILVLLALLASGGPFGAWTAPVLRGFMFHGGSNLRPEFIAMVMGLSIYNGAFMAEIFRSGLLSIPKGQYEAAATVGLTSGQANALIIIPQALRVAIPPAVSQYQNLIKASSLSAAIGYPDIMQVLGGTILAQAPHPLQVMIIVMALYLVITLFVSLMLNIYNAYVMRHGGAA